MILPNTEVVLEEEGTDDSRIISSLRSAENLDDAFAARNALVTKYLDLAAAAANASVPHGLAHFRDDAQQEACCALIEAAARYDAARGIPFARYAYAMMVFRVGAYLRLHRHPAQAERLGRAASKIWRVVRESGRALADWDDGELSRYTGLSEQVIKTTRPWLRPPVRLDSETEVPTAEVVSGEDPLVTEVVDQTDRRRRLREMLSELDPKDQYLLVTVFGLDGDDPVSIRTAVGALGCSAARGSFRIRRALKKLRGAWAD